RGVHDVVPDLLGQLVLRRPCRHRERPPVHLRLARRGRRRAPRHPQPALGGRALPHRLQLHRGLSPRHQDHPGHPRGEAGHPLQPRLSGPRRPNGSFRTPTTTSGLRPSTLIATYVWWRHEHAPRVTRTRLAPECRCRRRTSDPASPCTPPPSAPAAPPLRPGLPSGKGMWIWQPQFTERGDVAAIVDRAKATGLTHLYVRIGSSWDGFNAIAFLDQIVPAAHAAGLAVYAWD